MRVLSTIEDIDSTHSVSPPPSVHNEKPAEAQAARFSFYKSSVTNEPKSESKQNINVCDTDIEALAPQLTEAGSSNVGLVKNKSKCCGAEAWPSPQELKKKRRAEKRRQMKCCGCWVDLSKRTKSLLLLLIGLTIVALATGLGVGLSRRVGGGVYSHGSPNAPITS